MKIDYDFVVFLYAYINQIDLSLDRSRWESIDNLRNFYKNQISPKNIVSYLMNRLNLEVEKLDNLIFLREESFWGRIKDSLLSSFKKDIFLEEDNVYFLCNRLLLFDQFLEKDTQVHRLELEKLRIDFSKLNFGTLMCKLTRKDRLRAYKVEHFLQYTSLNTLSISEFSKNYLSKGR